MGGVISTVTCCCDRTYEYVSFLNTECHSFRTLRFFQVIRLCSHRMTFMLMTWKISSIFCTVIARISLDIIGTTPAPLTGCQTRVYLESIFTLNLNSTVFNHNYFCIDILLEKRGMRWTAYSLALLYIISF